MKYLKLFENFLHEDVDVGKKLLADDKFAADRDK